ncbi:SAM-dependent methyltransferase [Sphingobacteriales bacterium UPWRP_1]|nr:hypothetical protein BVG80_15075 [Sphingobacteriales bacterium TSM_CSM]PSJ79071.1 SAM-dependent methyltransferase [Sphingobacteriales bacterium UPWRP_1]
MNNNPHASKGKLYLIPNLLGGNNLQTIPAYVQQLVQQIEVFIVENTKEARRYLVKLGMNSNGKSVNRLTFLELDKHTSEDRFTAYLQPADDGKDIGLISDAGCPAVADPGSLIVRRAHEKNIEVVPLVGPSSLLLALMASGLNGQQFAFSGYLPIESAKKTQHIKKLEQLVWRENQTQIFIETPYRNQTLFADILKTCHPDLRLCVAANLTLPGQYIATHTIGKWKNLPPPELHKIPAVFLIGK